MDFPIVFHSNHNHAYLRVPLSLQTEKIPDFSRQIPNIKLAMSCKIINLIDRTSNKLNHALKHYKCTRAEAWVPTVQGGSGGVTPEKILKFHIENGALSCILSDATTAARASICCIVF